jgi:GTP-binding protein Era
MDNVVRESIADVDAIMLLVEPIASVGTQESMLIEQLKGTKIPAILVINKIDTLESKEELLAVIAAYSAQHDFAAIVPISAKTGEGVDALFDEVKKFAAPGPQLFPEDMVTDQPERQIMAEIIREKLLWCLDREVPHGTAVEIDRFSEREDSGIIDLEATIYCEKASHKGIIIGKNGAMLKKISTMARNDCEKFMGTKVYLRCWVKVKENWRDSDFLIKNFGYRE